MRIVVAANSASNVESATVKSTLLHVDDQQSADNEPTGSLDEDEDNDSPDKRESVLLKEKSVKNHSQSFKNSSAAGKSSCQTTVQSHSCDQFNTERVLLATTIIKIQGNDKLEHSVRVSVSFCSQASFISKSLCQRLKLRLNKVNLPITGTGGIVLSTVTKSSNREKSATHFATFVRRQRQQPVWRDPRPNVANTVTSHYGFRGRSLLGVSLHIIPKFLFVIWPK